MNKVNLFQDFRSGLGVSGNYMVIKFGQSLEIPWITKNVPAEVRAVDGSALPSMLIYGHNLCGGFCKSL